MLNHGGNLAQARATFSDVSGDWLDLSTGISPWSWPVPEVPVSVWQRLPEADPDFDHAVADYYGVAHLQAVAGSQVAIEALPQCLPAATVAVPRWGYGEHARCWSRAGHRLRYYHSLADLQAMLGEVEHAVVINPNNPTGEHYSVAELRQLQRRISGYLLVDEAFIDADSIMASANGQPSPSMLPYLNDGCLVVLRSIGKFFGLAGVRLGFVGVAGPLATALAERLPLWSISSPALWLATLALSDRAWQQQQCHRIFTLRAALQSLVTEFLAQQKMTDCQVSAGPLFVSIHGPRQHLQALFNGFARQAIWLRLFTPIEDNPNTYLRLGLPQSLRVVESALQSLGESW